MLNQVLYGTASAGGAGAAGTVFALNHNHAQFRTIHTFTALTNNETNADGAVPIAPLLYSGGSLYGTTFSGGPGTAGTVFSLPLPPVPALITNILRQADGSVLLSFLGVSGSTNIVQTSTNLVPPVFWHDAATNVADANGVWQFTDGSNPATRFYRSYAR